MVLIKYKLQCISSYCITLFLLLGYDRWCSVSREERLAFVDLVQSQLLLMHNGFRSVSETFMLSQYT